MPGNFSACNGSTCPEQSTVEFPDYAALPVSQALLQFLSEGNFSQEDILALMNGSDNYESWKSDWSVLVHDQWSTVIIILYCFVIIFGFLANLLVVVVIARYKQLHTVTNIFIGYLAVAEVALCVFNLPLQLHYQLHENWIFGRILCYVAMPTFGVPVFSSSLAILMIAVDRYMLIVYPFKTRISNRQALLAVVLIFLFTIALSTPLIVFVNYVELHHPLMGEQKIYCSEMWPTFRDKQIYAVSTFLLQFVLPLSLTSYFYKHICQVLHKRPVKKQDTRRNQRTTRILIAVVLTFTVSWLPWSLFSLTAEFNHQLVKGRYFTLIDLMLKVFAMSPACTNPFLYGWLNDNFKKELGRLFGHRLCWGRSGRLGATSYSRTTDVNGTSARSEVLPKSRTEMTVV